MTRPSEGKDEAVMAVARVVVDNLKSVAEAAAKRAEELGPGGRLMVASPVSGNGFGDAEPSWYTNQALALKTEAYESARQMKAEPFIARICVENESSGWQSVYYFSRGGRGVLDIGGVPDGVLLGYRGGAPLARLASFEAGDTAEIATPGGVRTFKILERLRLTPRLEEGRWDGRDNVFESENEDPARLSSLREFLRRIDRTQDVDNLVREIEAVARREEERRNERRRRVIATVALRDQAILDKYQDEIFRLPLNRRLALTGPPGTGKTTTLIKRIAQKSRFEEWSDEERSLVSDAATIPSGWALFTPTPALKVYLKEAFGREGVAASDERVRTWSDERRRLARNVLGILRSGQRSGFRQDDASPLLADPTSKGLIRLFEAFQDWFRRDAEARCVETLKVMSSDPDQNVQALARRVIRRLESATPEFDRLFDLAELREDIAVVSKKVEQDVSDARSEHVRRILDADGKMLERIAASLRSALERDEEDEEDEQDERAEPVAALDLKDERLARDVALRALRRAVDDAARTAFDARLVLKGGRSKTVLDEIASRIPDAKALLPLGQSLATLRQLRFLAEPHRNLIERVPSAYQRFRRVSLRERGAWFDPNAQRQIDQKRLEPAEVDLLIVMMLRNARGFLARANGRLLRDTASTNVALLDAVRREYVAQVLVDEATDFSPLELASMCELAHPAFRSFFVSGDYQQRITACGVQDERDVDWVVDDFEKRDIKIGYRQSRRLAELADVLARIRGAPCSVSERPRAAEDVNIAPLLAEHCAQDELAGWLCERIVEIERALGFVPPIAIFVDEPARMNALVDSLRPLLADHSHNIVACPDGTLKGTDDDIRVFDVQHVKGFEFEAVFFVGVDKLAARLPDLFDRHLFVGLTRAATYLGVTCDATLPPLLEPARSCFEHGGWR
ncbi:MAG: ATP-dependent helicase [Polyangiales bacterium]